jgi:hypothetical protein
MRRARQFLFSFLVLFPPLSRVPGPEAGPFLLRHVTHFTWQLHVTNFHVTCSENLGVTNKKTRRFCFRGAVGQHVRLTRGRSPVRAWAEVSHQPCFFSVNPSEAAHH